MTRILIADDHAIVRKGLKLLLQEEYPFAKIEETEDAESLLHKVISEEWDLVICDINMPGRSGLDALRQIKQISPSLPVLIMSMNPEDQYAIRVLKAGASAYLSKNTIHDELGKAIQMALRGKKYITSAVAEKLADSLGSDAEQQMHESLSNREFDVFKLLAEGKHVSEIANQLSLSTTTISTYRARILEKMNMHSNAEMTRYALEKGLI